MMDGIICKEEQIDDVAHTYENSASDLTELDFEDSVIHKFQAANDSCNVFENSAACHFFFPATEGFNERETLQDQVDPLAPNTDSYVYQSESSSIGDELLAHETSQTIQLSSFSVIDAQNILKSSVCASSVKPADIQQQNEKKLNVDARKTKLYKENTIQENIFPPIKKIKLEENPIKNEIILKKALVYIGPKLPLPICLQLKVINNVDSVSTKVEKLENTSSLKADQQEPNKKNHIVLKVYSCSKCNLKHTDPVLHEAHVVGCVSRFTYDVSTSQEYSYKDKKGLFCCEFCSFKFKHKRNLIFHQNKHIQAKGFICCVCGIELVSVKKLQNHYNDRHRNLSKIFCCNICEYSNITAKRLKEHIVTHNSDKYLFCYKCRQNYDSMNDFNQHPCKSLKKIRLIRNKLHEIHKTGNKKNTKSHHSVKMSILKSTFESEVIQNNGIYYCNGCSYTFSKYDSLIKHKKEHLKVQPYKCLVCNYESFSVVDMGKHVRCHLSEQMNSIKIKCCVCDMAVNKWQFLRKHAVAHVYDGLYCSSCRVNFENSESLIQHMTSSHNQLLKDKMYSCSKCSFSHPVATALRRHIIKVHSRQENNSVKEMAMQVVNSKFECDTLLENLNLEIEQTNSNETTSVSSTFKCNSCRLRFDSAESFEKHNKGHLSESALVSSDNEKSSTTKQLFKCKTCKFKCFDINSFIDHVKLNHLNKKKPFTCLVCAQKMKSLKTYLTHLTSHSEIPTYCCQYCKYHTRTKRSFLEHYINHNLKCCPMCIYSTPHFQALKKHLNRQHKIRNVQETYVCTLCPYSSSSEKVLSIHALKFHPKEYPSLKLPVPNYMRKSVKNNDDKFNACSMCQFTNHRIHDFKRHLTKHYVNGQLNVNTLSNRVKKKSLVQKSSNPYKFNNTCKNKASKNEATLCFYGCSQCSFKSKRSDSVSHHLLRIHNMKGSIKNNMVLKLKVPLYNDTKTIKLRFDKTIIKCLKCDVDKFSLRAQKQHQNLGHRAFWTKPFSCLTCKCRFKSEVYLDRHGCKNSKPLVCKICNKYKTNIEEKLKNHSQICVKSSTTTKEVSKPSKISHHQEDIKTQILSAIKDEEQLGSDDESFSCGECNFVTTDVTDLINHMFIHSGIEDD